MILVLVFAVFAPDTSPVTVEQLPQATDQENPIHLGSHQVVNVDTEQCLDSMLNNFQDVCQLIELQDPRYRLKVDLRRTLRFGRTLGRLNGC